MHPIIPTVSGYGKPPRRSSYPVPGRLVCVPLCVCVSRVSRVCPGSPRCLFTGYPVPRGQLSSKVGEYSKIPDMSGFSRPSLVSGRVLEESRNILIQTQEYTEKPRICLQLSYICHTFVYKNKAHSRASCAAVLKRFASRLKLF